MNKLYIYESGSLTYLKKNNLFYLATEWRDKLDKWAKDNGVYTFNPAKTFEIEMAHNFSGETVVRQNDLYLKKSNIMVVQMDYIDYSPGTIYELVTYKQSYPYKPVIAFSVVKENLYHKSPHIESCITEHCESIEDVINLLCVMFSDSLIR